MFYFQLRHLSRPPELPVNSEITCCSLNLPRPGFFYCLLSGLLGFRFASSSPFIPTCSFYNISCHIVLYTKSQDFSIWIKFKLSCSTMQDFASAYFSVHLDNLVLLHSKCLQNSLCICYSHCLKCCSLHSLLIVGERHFSKFFVMVIFMYSVG